MSRCWTLILMKQPLYLFPDMTNRKSLNKLTLHSRIKFDISLQDFFFLCVKALAIANPPKILYTYGETIRNVFRVYFFFRGWKTHEIIPPRTRKFATIRKNWPLQNNMIPFTKHLIGTCEALPYFQDQNKIYF